MSESDRQHTGRPNILFIMTDQHNPHIAGFAGDKHARTQALDSLAAKSTKFNAAYCQSPLCVPSRLSMLSGKYAHECSAWDNSSRLSEGHHTFARHLSENGYTTCLVGKMHLVGEHWMGGYDHRPYGDLKCGFPFHQPDPPETWDHRWNSHAVGRFPWAGKTQIPESLLVDEVATREALAFLREHDDENPDQPWMMTVSYNRPHFPLTAPGRYVRRALADQPPLPALPEGYPDSVHPHDRLVIDDFRLTSFSAEEHSKALAAYYACVDYVDDCIGELLAGLENDGLLDNTYIIYTSDHGEMAAEHGLWWKRTYYDASARVPLLIAGPGIEGGDTCDLPVELIDLYPTFCEMAGIEPPNGLPGESLLPICRGQVNTRSKKHAQCALYQGNNNEAWMFRMVRGERYKLVEFALPESPAILFDLKNDPGETDNLLAAGRKPPTGDDIDELWAILRQCPDWPDIIEQRESEKRHRAAIRGPKPANPKPREHVAPAQYMMPDGRIIDADRAVYPGL